MDDEHAYLRPDFDPMSITIPRLRNILISHNVSYPSSAKKADLVALFQEHVAPQADDLMADIDGTQRSAEGIRDASPRNPAQAQDPVALDTPATTRRTGRRTTRAAVDETPASRPARKSTAASINARSRAQAAEDDQHGQDPIPTTQRVNKVRSRQTLTSRHSDLSAPDHDQDQGESPFSSSNPFQSGSSPPSANDRRRSSKKRVTLTPTVHDEYDDTQASAAAQRSSEKRRTMLRPSRETVRSQSSRDALVKLEQELTDDEVSDQDMMSEDEAEQEVERNTSRRPMPLAKRPAKKTALTKAAPWTLVLALLGGIGTLYRQEKIQIGYCGTGRPAGSTSAMSLPGWASALQPRCEPCPQHAYCYPGLKTVCEPDFIETPHPLSFGGFVPLAPTCEPDSAKVKKIKQVADFAVETVLREQNAKHECGEAKAATVAVQDLKATVAAKRSRKLNDKDFDELWDSAMDEIVGREEVTSSMDGSRRLLRSSSLALLPLGCSIKRSVRSTLRQHLLKLVGLAVLSLAAVYGRYRLSSRTSTASRAKHLAGVALDKLAEQASLHAVDGTRYPEPWISIPALRDDVLREEFSARERLRLWAVVSKLVEDNSNVRPMQRESRTSGEMSRVWEWIGALNRIESRPSTPDLRRSSSGYGLASRSRQSLGAYSNASPEDAFGRRTPDQSELLNMKRWTDGGSQYF